MVWNKQKDIQTNRLEYGEAYDKLRWVTEEQAGQAETQREELLAFLKGDVLWGFTQTKLDCQNLSAGCGLCGEGTWSCLFINGICNAHCFYCPTEQLSKSDPMTNSITFARSKDYLDFVKRFNFRGVSLSGGEPLITFDRTLHFASEIKNTFGDRIYLWVYTNGILADREKVIRIKKAGLDEIRFNISVCKYRLEKVKLAVDLIPVVTVEIPAIPEDEELLRKIIVELQAMGVAHINLHQLRCTPHNRKYLDRRNYTFIHGPKVTILESELCALRMIRFVKENKIDLPVNYCSFVYKHRYQSAGLKKRCAPFLLRPYEKITESGMIRTLSVQSKPEEMILIAEKLERAGCPRDLWQLASNKTRLYFHESLWKHLDLRKYPPFLSYYAAELRSSLSYRNPFREILLNQRKKVYVERKSVLVDKELKAQETELFEKLFLQKETGQTAERTGLGEIYELEHIKPGLQEYY